MMVLCNILVTCNLSNTFQVAKLTDEDTIAINNLRMLGGEPDTKKTSTSSFALKFDMHKVKVIFSLNILFFQCNVISENCFFKLSEKACSKERSFW